MNALVDSVERWQDAPEEAFHEWLFSSNYSDRTVLTYNHLFLKLLNFLEKNKMTIKNVNGTVFRKFLNSITVSQKSKRIYARQFLSVFEHLCEIGILDDNPANEARKMEKGHAEKKLPTVLSRVEQEKFMKAIETGRTWTKRRERIILLLLATTGIRCSEVATLKIEHVDLGDSPKIRVYGKGRKEREIPIPAILADEIEGFLARIKREQGFLFADKTGKAPAPNTIYEMVRRTFDRAGIIKEKMGPHVLRHTFATRQFESGIPPAVIRNWMGHASLTTTLIYEHVVGTPGGMKPA